MGMNRLQVHRVVSGRVRRVRSKTLDASAELRPVFLSSSSVHSVLVEPRISGGDSVCAAAAELRGADGMCDRLCERVVEEDGIEKSHRWPDM